MGTRTANKNWYAKNPTYPRDYYRERVAKDPRYSFARNIKHKYGMTLDDFDRMADAQGNACAICGDQVKLYIDHDHDTGAPRKLLCAMCNTGLGRFRDNLDRLRKAVAYMESFSVGEE